jgi:hypothetical protein
MWLLLKAEKPDEAWNKLVDAQASTRNAIRAHDRFSGIEQNSLRLASIEKLIFPPQIFLSSGLIVRSQICSICGLEYNDCSHVVGRPYWGELCFRHLRDFTANHIAIVTNPANKRCRITQFNTDEGIRNRMTWRVEPYSEIPADAPSKGLATVGIVLSIHDLKS